MKTEPIDCCVVKFMVICLLSASVSVYLGQASMQFDTIQRQLPSFRVAMCIQRGASIPIKQQDCHLAEAKSWLYLLQLLNNVGCGVA